MENASVILKRLTADVDAPSFISKLVSKDKALLQNVFSYWRPYSNNYEDSWGYIIQATRYGGFKWYDPNTNSLIFFCKKSATDPTIVIPNFFATPDYLASAITSVQRTFQTSQTILKNVSYNDINLFSYYGFRPYKKHESWSNFSRFDDQTHPQLIVNLEQLAYLNGHEYHKLRNVLSKKPTVSIREYQTTDKESVLQVLAARDGNTSKPFREQKKGMYYESHSMYPSADLDKFVVLDNKTHTIIGFLALSQISSSTIAFVASIFKPEAKNSRAWCEYQLLLRKYHEGFQFVNLGGNEREGDYHFKLWTFRPIDEIDKTHLTYDP